MGQTKILNICRSHLSLHWCHLGMCWSHLDLFDTSLSFNKSLLYGYRPIEESSESEDETEAGSETSGDLNSSGEGGEGGEAPVPPA